MGAVGFDWSSIIIAIIGFLGGGGLMGVLTLKQTKKKGDIEALQGSISALQSIIDTLRSENERKDQQLADYAANRAEHVKKYEDKCEQAASAKMMMCVHMGCTLRDPMLGQGDSWFEAHKDNISLGVDYTPINVLMRRLGAKRKLEDNGTEAASEV